MILKQNDTYYLKKTLDLAKKGLGHVSLNPMVGAVLVKDGKIIGQGYHKKFGGNHGEIEALKSCKVNPKGSTLYVNLEPCCHYGKTPPCTKAIIDASIKEVVCCTADPNPIVSGKGFLELKNAGIKIKSGLLEDEAKKLNEVYFTNIKEKRSFVVLKIAMSLDGKITSNDSKWITGLESRKLVHKLRTSYDAILVGINTVSKDDCHLGVRLVKGRDPKRIIIDPTCKIPLKAKVLRDKNVILISLLPSCLPKPVQLKISQLKKQGFKFIHFKDKINLKILLKKLYSDEKIGSVLVEGGSYTFTSFVNEKLFDKIMFFVAPKIIGEGLPAFGEIRRSIELKASEVKMVGEDVMISFSAS